MSKISWGLIGGGENSQIGFAHRAAAVLSGRFSFAAGALDADPARGRAFGHSLGLSLDRSYESWQALIAHEQHRADAVSLVTVATPNATHFTIAKGLLEAGFDVLCEKPLTMTAEDAETLRTIAEKANRVCAVNYGYSGYPLIRQMRAMVAAGELGAVRVVMAQFAGGFMADAGDADNPRVRWRFDPKQAGVAAITFDCGVHALHLACYVTGQRITSVSSDFAHGVKGRALEDDNLSAFRMSGGTVGRLWASGLAIGRTHGLTLQICGEKGGLYWRQEQPNQLLWTPLNDSTRVLERGAPTLSAAARRASHLAIGHPEGLVLAFANIYRDLADVMQARSMGARPDPLAMTYPNVHDGCHSVKVVHAMATSAQNRGQWINV